MTKPPVATKHCRHYSYERGPTGMLFGEEGCGPTCAVGVDLMSEPGAARRCMPSDCSDPFPVCSQREEYTDAERAAYEAWRDESIAQSLRIVASIPRDGDYGELPCPRCGSGTITWGRASSNGHLHAGCSTPDCFGVIQ